MLHFDYDTDGSVVFGVEEDIGEMGRASGPMMEVVSALS